VLVTREQLSTMMLKALPGNSNGTSETILAEAAVRKAGFVK